MSDTPAQCDQVNPLPAQERTYQIVEVVRREDFPVFYRAEKKHLTAFLMYVGASVWEADDLAHEALIVLLPDRWMIIEHPRAYLRKVAFHAYLRQNQRDREVPTAMMPDLPGGLCPVSHVALAEQTRAVVNAIEQLPTTQRTVMAFVLSGAKPAEIARTLNMTPGAVNTNVCRARASLKTALGLAKGEKHV